ncbi:YqeG family HAD IIIA-type phosphatase [Umezakia ovalisporum]|jgi:HAD superfamily phosphatase (TIGR01668 family)|uniref:YqeG family HAD IIIA-type phosphatase n=2 Tax=Umezakia ovalisporum TaxID=75695 RepID=A0AA43GZH5_9CYAN|nr:YqeG family HAD IIIA-type phosphatase [Umezakia ovalisporum]MBI1243205.1 YqeG family HAD IIIA-type phosphatase [Nostoc sp. RI_552]MDH6055638.1 YqeG family HAD IIIA-type phosphatase [Umezakia ovalisporum FSS-43]MDH6064641.1 YqeG family HAD IIIA-type phosphatase [Umezakia ovalisporum FSS-62]MDH6067663.1 YqeG family HAD IIIA-type phosphatase [Umezakia ovalisporum APH033B]MDH6069641.1 YqeG family HAD IIIA-type phosphatase [Umezakia ovalisporum CobakiLakeA]
MIWNKLLQPDLILEGSVLNLTPEIIQQYGLKGLVLDVDETLVPLTVGVASVELQQWVEQIRSSTELCLVSNNLSEARIGGIARSLNLPYYLGAAKPSRRKIRAALTAMNLPVHQVGMVGDRLFTDVIAGNRLGMFTILVDPIVHPDVALGSHPIRNFEVWISEILGATITAKETKIHKT